MRLGARVPFSTFGSWISISIPGNEGELYFRNHHGGPNDLFPLKILSGNEVVTPAIEADPWLMILTHGEGRVEICFERSGTVRMRGRELGLRLGAKNLAYTDGPNRVVFNCPFTRRYQVEALRGKVDLSRTDPETPHWAKQAVIAPAEDGFWELAERMNDRSDSTDSPAAHARMDDEPPAPAKRGG